MKYLIKKHIKKGTFLYCLLKIPYSLLEKLKKLLTAPYIIILEHYYHLKSRKSKKRGVLKNNRAIPLIVSLTTIPGRIKKVHLCIETLLEQSCKPDSIILWLSDSITENEIPKDLKNMESRGLQIRFCKDIRSYKKIIYTLMEHPRSVIVTADDDVLYPKYWLSRLYESYQKDPEYIHCHRAHLMKIDDDGKLKNYIDWLWCSPGVQGPSLLLIPTGSGGVLYPPGSLNSEVLNIELFMQICQTGDDVWLKAMSLLNGTSCKKVRPYSMNLREIRGIKTSLWDVNMKINNNMSGNDQQIQAVFMHYGLMSYFQKGH